MAQLAGPRLQASLMPEDGGFGFPFSERDNVEPQGSVELTPNPDFVFPARPTETPSSPSLQHWTALHGQSEPPNSPRPSPLRQRQHTSVSALPAFSFNPSSSATVPPLKTPPQSPGLTTPTSPNTPSRATIHRRGGSEFIGGDGKGGSGLMSSSPTKGNGVLPPPVRLGPPPGRRGHAHKRSGAVSVHDIQSILQPKDANAQSRAGSAPTTPMEAEHRAPLPTPSHARRATSESCLRGSLEQPASADVGPEVSPQRRPAPVRRAVGFAERVEYIRPLSTISSETESSMSTVRGHSVTNSLSSILSAGASSPPTARLHRASLTVTVEDDDLNQRPRTAGDVLDSQSKCRDGLGVLTHLNHRPRSAQGFTMDRSASPTGSGSPKRKPFAWWEHKGTSKESAVPAISPDLALISSESNSPLLSPAYSASHLESEDVRASTQHPRPMRAPRKVKSWASSIMSRKSKPQLTATTTLKQRPLTPPPVYKASRTEEQEQNEEEHKTVFNFESFEPDFDADNTVTILSTPSPKQQSRSLTSELSPSRMDMSGSDEDSASPVIDLDAALGPFNTPPLGPNARSGNQGRPARARHSMRGFNNPAHRRAESAPELVPFENKVKSPFMEEVFEEEDEDACDVQKLETRSANASSTTEAANALSEIEEPAGMGIHVLAHDTAGSPKLVSWPPKPRLSLPRLARSVSPQPGSRQLSSGAITPPIECPTRSISPFVAPVREPTPVEVVEADEEPRASSMTRDSDSTITPSMTPDGGKEPQALMTLSLPMPQQPVMTPDSLSSSSFSGRDFTTSSQASIDTPRLGTATSYGTECRSISFGEPGPEVRMSYEDVPSLTSSRSTMTSPAQHPLAGPGSAFTSDDPRSMSFTLPFAPERTRKRASIASLSRLVGLSSGERSKLSIESRPQSQHSNTAKGQERRKSKRLSKLVNFFTRRQNEAERC